MFSATFDPDTTDIEDMMRVQIMVAWEMMSFKQTQLNGIVVVCDGAGFSRHQIKALTPGHIQKMLAMTLVIFLALKFQIPSYFTGNQIMLNHL